MTGIPNQALYIRDPGLGLTTTAGAIVFWVGTSERGELGAVTPIGTPADAVDELGEGPLSEAVAYGVSRAGGPQYAVRVDATLAGESSDVTKEAQGASTGTLTVSDGAFDRYEATIEIMRTGGLGTALFRYSLDGGRTYSESLTVPSGGTYAVPRAGLTLTFVAGAGPLIFERGDAFMFDTTAPHYGAAEIASAFDAIDAYLGGLPGVALDFVALTGVSRTGAAGAVAFASLGAKLDALQVVHQYAGGLVDVGSDDTDANVKTALASVVNPRVSPIYGYVDLPSAKPFTGFALPRMPLVNAVAARAAIARISVDLARTSGDPREAGAIPGALGISHDEYRRETLDAAKITTARTWPGTPGYFFTNVRLKSAAGSDFLYWQHRRIMDVACRVVIAAQQQFMSAEFLTTPTGSLQEKEARRIEEVVRDKLREALLDPVNASGRPGHVSDFVYSVSRTNNVLSTQTLISSVAIRPHGYVKYLQTEIGYALNLGAAA